MKPKILTTMASYSRGLFFDDLAAGVTVALVALPLSIAIAIASGATPAAGLVTAIVAGLLISMFGGSRVQIGGPTGAFIVVVAGVIAQHGYDGLIIATLMAGVILVVAGVLRAGNLISYVPEPVINGFTIGIAVIIASSQLKDFTGVTMATVPAEFLAKVQALWTARDSLNGPALGIALVTMVLIIGLRRLAPKLPGLILAVAITSMIAVGYAMPVETIFSRFGALPDQLPVPTWPVLTVAKLIDLLPSALVIAFLAGVESLLSAMVADRMIASSHRPNAEVLAQGLANIGSALFGGLPATGAIARTATNIRAGGKTPVAGIVHALTVLLLMMLFGGVVGYMAMPALAALLMLTAWNMSEPHKWRGYLSTPFEDRVLLLVTLLLTVLTDLTIAIAVGIGLGLILRSRRADWTLPVR